MDWLNILEPKLSLANTHVDILGDWYRDPWSWPELAWLVEESPERLAARLNDSGARRVILIDVPKENFVIRPALLLDPLDRLMYQALVDRISHGLIGNLPGWAYGWRLPRETPSAGRYAKNTYEWSFYRKRLQLLAELCPFGLATDITSFFATVQVHALIEDLRARAGNGRVVERLADFLVALQSIPTRSGLPQRCWASSVLAHFYLHPIDDLLQAASKTVKGTKHSWPGVTRWMDDIWLFGTKALPLRLVQIQLQDVLRQRGLNMNTARTELYEGADLQEQAKELEHSAVDEALSPPSDDDTPLRALVDELLLEPSTASRTSLRFATTRIRKYKKFDMVAAFAENALELAHAADHIARLFRDSEAWRDLVHWYVTVQERFGSSLTWTIYHLGTMFPSSEVPAAQLKEFWTDSLAAGGIPLLMLPLVAQRVSGWDRDAARAAFRAAVTKAPYQHPFALRVLALAGLSAHMPPTDVRNMLGQFQENELTLRYLEAQGMKAPRIGADFGGL